MNVEWWREAMCKNKAVLMNVVGVGSGKNI
jgi:hypothetical protein